MMAQPPPLTSCLSVAGGPAWLMTRSMLRETTRASLCSVPEGHSTAVRAGALPSSPAEPPAVPARVRPGTAQHWQHVLPQLGSAGSCPAPRASSRPRPFPALTGSLCPHFICSASADTPGPRQPGSLHRGPPQPGSLRGLGAPVRRRDGHPPLDPPHPPPAPPLGRPCLDLRPSLLLLLPLAALGSCPAQPDGPPRRRPARQRPLHRLLPTGRPRVHRGGQEFPPSHH